MLPLYFVRGKWGQHGRKKRSRCCMEHYITAKVLSVGTRTCGFLTKVPFACPPRSLKLLHFSCRSPWTRSGSERQGTYPFATRFVSQIARRTTSGHVGEQVLK